MTKKTFDTEVLERVAQEAGLTFSDETKPEIEQTAWEWFQTSEAFCEERRRKAEGQKQDKHWKQRQKIYAEIWERHPRQWYVADCPDCEWAMGGWSTKEHATAVLKIHADERHTITKKPPSKD